jgi:hypothetical protein
MRARMLVLGLFVAGALWLAPIPGTAQITIGIDIGTPPLPAPPRIVIPAPPQLVVIPGTAVSYAPAMPYDYFWYGGKHYLFQEGAWFSAPAHRGPWTAVAVERVPQPILRVPVTYYKVPPGHRKEEGPPRGKGHGQGHKHKKHKDHDD